MRVPFIVLVLCGIAGCAGSDPVLQPPDMPTSKPAAAKPGFVFDAPKTQKALDDYKRLRESMTKGPAVGTTVTPDQGIPPDTVDGYGALLLPKGHQQNNLACETYFNSLIIKRPDQVIDANRSRPGRFALRPIFWLSLGKNGAALDLENGHEKFSVRETSALCKTMVETNYDFERASFIAETIGKVPLSGPTLAMWKVGSNAPGNWYVERAIIFDLSRLKTPVRYSDAFRDFQKLASTDASLWSADRIEQLSWIHEARERYSGLLKGVDGFIQLRRLTSTAIAKTTTN